MPHSTSPVQQTGPVVVRKYGGSSLADIARLREVARDLKAARDRGERLVVVVSAMGNTTDELDAQARQANPHPPRRELDMLLTVGERISMSLLCMALDAEGVPAMSFTGSQAGIITDNSHTDAQILAVRPIRVPEALDAGKVVVIAGFQGVCAETKEITTLGRGGTDTTAVALAHALGAERCEILKDVPGVMSADPKVVPSARRLEQLDYDQMQSLADAGCGVVHAKAVAYARQHGVALYVGSSFDNGPGTEIGPAAPQSVEPAVQFHPLALNVGKDQARLVLGSPGPGIHPGLEAVARRATMDGPLTCQWLAGGDRWFWEGWGPARHLQAAASQALALAESEPDEVMALWDDDLAVLTVVGNQPDNWTAGLSDLRQALIDLDAEHCPLRSDGDRIRILVPAARLRELATGLHDTLLGS